MELIHWPTIIRGLTDAGLTQPDIARLCGCGQSTISDLLRGTTNDPRTSTGLRLLGLARDRGIFDPSWPNPEGEAAGATLVAGSSLHMDPPAGIPMVPVSPLASQGAGGASTS